MNYYEHHLGDYDGATAHLSWLEDCAYRRLLSLYYRTEAPIPGDLKQACRLVRATSKPERDAVQQALTEFFALVDGAWHHDRCDTEIAKYRAKSQKARESVSKRWANRDANAVPTAYERNTTVSGDTDTNVVRTHNEGNTPRTRPQSPDTKHHTEAELPRERAARSSPPPRPDDVPEQTYADWLALRKAKRAPVSATTLEEARKQAVLAGMTLEAFLRVWCRRGSQGLEASWLRADERPSNVVPVESFRERDQRLATERVAAFTGRRPADTREIIDGAVSDVTPRALGR